MTNRFFFPRPRRSCLLSPAFSWLRGAGAARCCARSCSGTSFSRATVISLSLPLSLPYFYGRDLRGEREKRKPAFSEENATKHVLFFEVARLPPGFLLLDTPLRESLSLSPPSLDILNQTKRNSDPLRQRPVRRRQPRRRRRRVRAKGKREGEKRSDGLSERRQPGNSLF